MGNNRVIPRARQGTTGLSQEHDLQKGESCYIIPPDRVAEINIGVHWGAGTAKYKIETTGNLVDYVDESFSASGGTHTVYWDNLFGYNADGSDIVMAEEVSINIINTVTAIRVTNLSDENDTGGALNVWFVG